jgi:hypothetical protein
MSFDEYVFLAGFIQKTVKRDLHVRGNHGILPQELHGKTLEDSRRLSTEAHHEGFHVGPTRLWAPGQPLVATSVSHCLLGCISAVS